MVIEVRLFATLRRYAPDSPGDVLILQMSEGSTVAQVIHELRMDNKEINLIMVNGTISEADSRLSDGDRLGLFPPIGGG
jgi:sulfur-carrier protein